MTASHGAANLHHSLDVWGPIWTPAILPWLWIGVLALTLQLLLVKVVGTSALDTTLLIWAVFTSHLLLVPFLLRNIRYTGIKLVLLGLSLNLLAMASNGGLMPVAADGIDAVGQQGSFEPGDRVSGSKDIFLVTPHLPQLTDRIVVHLPGHVVRVISIGDVIVALGTIAALASVSMKVLRPTDDKKALRPVGAR